MLLQHRQNGFGGKGNLYVHGVMHSVRVLTDGSGETASTLKIVSDVTAARRCDEAAHADRDSLRAAHLPTPEAGRVEGCIRCKRAQDCHGVSRGSFCCWTDKR